MQRSYYGLLLVLACCTLTTRSLHAGWEATNGPFANAINCFYADGSTFLVGTSTGIYRSEDEGGHWLQTSEQFIGSDFCAIGKTIYAGTREHGIIISHDTGKTWEEIGTPLPEIGWISALIFHDGRLYAGTTYTNVYVSPDSGRTWTIQSEGLPEYYYNPTFAVANNRLFIGVANNFGGTEGGVFILDGNKWKPTSLRNLTGLSLSVVGSRLIVGEYGVLYTSDDNGTTWTEHRENIPLAYIRKIVQFGSTLFAGTDGAGVWTSDDNGLTWSQNVLAQSRINLLTLQGATLVAGTEREGLLVTSNSGVSWAQKNEGLQSINSLSGLLNDKNHIYAIDAIAGTVSHSTDQGITWQMLPYLPAPAVAITTYNNRLILAARTGGIFISDNGGATWSTGSGNFDQLGFNALIALDHTVLVGAYNSNLSDNKSSGLLYSENAGASWSQADLPSHVYAFARHGTRVFAGTPAGVFSSDDEGRHWTARNTTLPLGGEVYALVSNGAAVFASFFREGVYVSEDNGENWLPVNGLPNNMRVDAFASFDKYVFAGSTQGIFMTADNGKSWERIDPVGDSLTILSLVTDGTYLYAGTGGKAVWRRALSDIITTSVSEPVASPHFLLYPQPMSETALLELGAECDVHDAVLTLTTLDGRLVLTQPHLYGHSITIRRAGLPAGAYMFTLRQDDRTVASGIVVIE